MWQGFAIALFSADVASGQTVVPLVEFTNVWRYDASGADRGMAWRTNDYDDSTWVSGAGLLQSGETTPYPAPFQTTLPGLNGKVTYYFRTWFTADEMPAGTVLVASNLVDDGCVLYLNGVEAGRVRMPVGQPLFSTLALVGPTTEGQFDVLTFPTTAMRNGFNLVAAEVHQAATTSADVVWGASLRAFIPEPLVIVRQPADQVIPIGASFTLSVGLSGGPAFYQWRKDGAVLSGATNATFSVSSASLPASGRYSVAITNALSEVMSDEANVLVYADRAGPTVESATGLPSPTNRIDVRWSENISAPSVATARFSVRHLITGEAVLVTNVLVSGRLMRLLLSGTAWREWDPYELTVDGVRDNRGYAVAPGTRVPVRWSVWTNAIPAGALWRFHNSGTFDSGVYAEPWTSPAYVEKSLWGAASGVFHRMPEGFVPCLTVGSLGLDVGYQAEPYLYRTTFDWPASRGTNATLLLRYSVDDGAVFYLNGVEIYRFNQGAGSITALSRATLVIDNVQCVTNVTLEVTNLVAGSNVLAVAVTQASFPGGDTLMGCTAELGHFVAPVLSAEPAPVLRITNAPPSGSLSWSGGGYTIETSTNLADTLSYPLGPWLEVSNAANPYLLPSAPDAARFYRLKKK